MTPRMECGRADRKGRKEEDKCARSSTLNKGQA